jgi:molybdopterin synthase sulfur carrier subunit
MVRLVYLARLRDAFGVKTEEWPLNNETTVSALLDELRGRGGIWAQELASGRAVRVAVNHALARADSRVTPGDEVALLPPVTGG